MLLDLANLEARSLHNGSPCWSLLDYFSPRKGSREVSTWHPYPVCGHMPGRGRRESCCLLSDRIGSTKISSIVRCLRCCSYSSAAVVCVCTGGLRPPKTGYRMANILICGFSHSTLRGFRLNIKMSQLVGDPWVFNITPDAQD